MSQSLSIDQFVRVPSVFLNVGAPLAVTLYKYMPTKRTMERFLGQGEILDLNSAMQIQHAMGIGICVLKSELEQAINSLGIVSDSNEGL